MIAQSLLAALVAAVTGSGTAPDGVVRPVLTPLPQRLVRPVRTPLPEASDLAARIVDPVQLRSSPGGDVVARLGPRTEFGSPRIVPVVRREGDWLGVIATERPNGELGWVPAGRVRLVEETMRLKVDLSSRVLRVLEGGVVVARMTVGIGSSDTPTPTGTFAVTDGIKGWGPYGCCILALSGHQPKLAQGWTGGDRLAVHGTPAGGSIGGSTSLGCLRARAADLRRLMRMTGLGTRVDIQA